MLKEKTDILKVVTDEGIEGLMVKFQKELADLINEAATYGELFKKNEDNDRYNKIKLFGNKLVQEEYMIGFAGHFSAGKSSMINALTGVDLLPSSPIPTSANIVKVRKTETDYAVIHLTDGKAVKYGGHGFSDAVKSFSKDGAAVSLVEIGHKESALPEGITVMDTPGVDSTDDAHRLSTESALHLADLVFYTMDYNHVQSELNFNFTKDLIRYNSNVYLIINQIDKHRESEISFEHFKQSVEDSFKMWGVEPKGIFYTSLFDLAHPHNDFEDVKDIVEGSMENWKESFIHNAHQTINALQKEHEQFLEEEIFELKDSASTLIAEDEWAQKTELLEELIDTEKILALFNEKAFTKTFEKEQSSLLHNATITPYETRVLLERYLESQSPRFKVGFLFGAKKTEEERQKRKEEFSENINKLLHTQIEIHLKALMKKSLKDANILTDEQSLSIDALDMTIPFTTIIKQFNASDIITGDTVLNISNQMKTNITIALRQLTDTWKDEMAQIVKSSANENADALLQKADLLKEKVQVINRLEELTFLSSNIEKEVGNPSLLMVTGRENLVKQWNHNEVLDITEYVADEGESLNQLENFDEEEASIQGKEHPSLTTAEEVIERADLVARIVKNAPGFIETAEYLRKKSKRLEGQEFTIALFGAFSAGKSSFSNALIGENILPVSPNPTTATINRIRPVSKGKEDGTADVILKTADRMAEDVIRSFEALGVDVSSLDEAYEKVDDAINSQLVDEKLQIHKAFITAFKEGYPIYGGALGTVLKTEREEFVKFVAEENRSCFVESIDFYFDCELTRKGITLVDTPGADSINARHTDVAFDYIRNADAILFVTYYNHAFARADREFLIQLGRVKDAFELDKMFFIVNAIDLATNDEEAESVKSFVGGELQKFGIRNPRVHGISSLQALEAKTKNHNNPNMLQFEEDFHQFLVEDLKGLAVQSLEEETLKTTQRLASLISRTELNMERKSERLIELAQLEENVKKKYEQSFVEVFEYSSRNELNELVHYILQRVFFRYSDFFKEAYNPSIFTTNSTSQALTAALDETVNRIGFDLTQELKVTNLRMLNFLLKQLTNRQRAEANTLKELDEAFAPTLFEPNEADMLSFTNPFTDPTVYSSVNRLFKNARSFFEKGDRDILKVRLEELLKKDSEAYLEEERKRIEKWVIKWIEEEAEALRMHLIKECITQINSERTLLEGTEKIDEWRRMYDNLLVKELV